MQTISDDVRDVADEMADTIDGVDDVGGWVRELRDIADRIDRDMLPLPQDPDGRTWHVGDVLVSKDGQRLRVPYISLTDDGWDVNGWKPEEISHWKPRTVQEIASEMAACAGASAAQVHAWAQELKGADR